MKLIVGLGNPGEKYAKVRHNLGWSIIDALVTSNKAKVTSSPNEKLVTCYLLPSEDVILAKPMTYMNNSGLAVKVLSDEFMVHGEDIIVIHDDLDLPLGKIKVRLGGAAAGHHGVESIINAIGTDQFIRIRLGIGNLRTQSSEHKHAHVNAEKFVLEPFMPQEKSKVKHMLKQAVGALEFLLEKGLTVAQNQFN